MAIYKPSHLSPNFEEVIYGEPLIFSFQANCNNNSMITAYKLEILTENNDEYEEEKNVLGVIYGVFDTPLYDKEFGYIIITQNILNIHNINLRNKCNYRWRIRLYDSMSAEVLNSNLNISQWWSYTGCDLMCSMDDYDLTCPIYYTYNSNIEDMYMVLSDNWINDFSSMGDQIFNSIDEVSQEIVREYVTSDHFVMFPMSHHQTKINSMIPKDFSRQILCIRFIQISAIDNNQYQINTSFTDGDVLNFKGFYYKRSLNADLNLTYVGNGNLVGSTKQVMWSDSWDKALQRNLYIETWAIPQNNGTTDFQPFESFELPFDGFTECIRIKNYIPDNGYFIGIEQSAIKKEYRDKLTDGNMYIQAFDERGEYKLDTPLQIVNTTKLNNGEGYLYLEILPEQFPYDGDNVWEPLPGDYITLFYIQREKIIQVDKNIGNSCLTKISLEKPMQYNLCDVQNDWNHQSVFIDLQSNNFDYDRVYIQPIEEFDNKDNVYYIHIYNTSQGKLTSDSGNYSASNIETNCHKIINYVATTGEVTLYHKMSFVPNRFFKYQIFKRKPDDNTQYICIDNSDYNLGGGSAPSGGGLFTLYNTYVNDESYYYNTLFLQPNLLIKDDFYRPIMLEVYNNKHSQNFFITNQIESETVNNSNDTWAIDKLDDTMWLTYAISMGAEYSDTENDMQFDLMYPQTKYKIYSNFVDSIPEGYFYVRNRKETTFYVGNLNSIHSNQLNSINGGTYHISTENNNVIPYRDLFIKCECKSDVPLKQYRYEILTENKEVVYSTEETYDQKFMCEYRGCENDSIYIIKIYVEDDYGKLFTSSIKIKVEYDYIMSNESIQAYPLCEKQAVHLKFSPIKEITSDHPIVYTADTNSVQLVQSYDFLTFCNLQDTTENQITLPNLFSYMTTFVLDASILKQEDVYVINSIQTQSGDIYELKLDTRSYYKNENQQYCLNDKYMQLIWYKNNIQVTNNIYDYQEAVGGSEVIKPNRFAYIMGIEETSNAIYIAVDHLNDIEESLRESFISTVPIQCWNITSETGEVYTEETTNVFAITSGENTIYTDGALLLYKDTEDDTLADSKIFTNSDYNANEVLVRAVTNTVVTCKIQNKQNDTVAFFE